MIDFTEEQIQRYSRHILLQDVGVEGQEKIMNARVLVVGAGGLGAPVSLYLAAAGIGRIGIVDADVVDLSNLQRQVIHFTKDVGVPKVKSAEEKIKAINPDVQVNDSTDRPLPTCLVRPVTVVCLRNRLPLVLYPPVRRREY